MLGQPMRPADGLKSYLGKMIYNDSKFYWRKIEPMHIISTLRRCKSGSVDMNCTDTSEEGSTSHLTCSRRTPAVTCGHTHFQFLPFY